jgi:hypothetical protein
MNAKNNYLFKYITLWNSILFENQGVTYLESLTDTQLIQLHLVSSSFSDGYRLCDIFQFIPL